MSFLIHHRSNTLEIKHSVDLLWETCCLGKPDERRGKNKASNYVADLMKKLEELQHKDELPCFVVDSIGLSQLPKFGIEDISEIGLADRIRRVEIKLLRIYVARVIRVITSKSNT